MNRSGDTGTAVRGKGGDSGCLPVPGCSPSRACSAPGGQDWAGQAGWAARAACSGLCSTATCRPPCPDTLPAPAGSCCLLLLPAPACSCLLLLLPLSSPISIRVQTGAGRCCRSPPAPVLAAPGLGSGQPLTPGLRRRQGCDSCGVDLSAWSLQGEVPAPGPASSRGGASVPVAGARRGWELWDMEGGTG